MSMDGWITTIINPAGKIVWTCHSEASKAAAGSHAWAWAASDETKERTISGISRCVLGFPDSFFGVFFDIARQPRIWRVHYYPLDVPCRCDYRIVVCKSQPLVDGLERLTLREWQLCGLLLSGLSIRAIGEEIRVSASTIESHVRNIRIKLGAKNQRDMIRSLSTNAHLWEGDSDLSHQEISTLVRGRRRR